MKLPYYLYFALSRLCRASKDRAWGHYRVHVLLLLIEINLVYGILFAFFRGWIHAVGEVPFIFGTVVPMTIINVYLFSSDTKREKYEREFSSYSKRKRMMADILAAMLSLSAILLPFSAELG